MGKSSHSNGNDNDNEMETLGTIVTSNGKNVGKLLSFSMNLGIVQLRKQGFDNFNDLTLKINNNDNETIFVKPFMAHWMPQINEIFRENQG